MTILDKINATKAEEVANLKEKLINEPDHPINKILLGGKREHHRRFENALRAHSVEFSNVAVISEIKRRSPSVGSIGEIADPTVLGKVYEAAGAACISCLTDQQYFGGSMEDLYAVCKAVSIPVLRKDFVVDKVQIAEAIVAGASCVLLIVASLGERTREFLEICEEWGVCALVEVHDKEELDIAVAAGARMLGVNNRNLKTFEVKLDFSENLRPFIPKDTIAVAESGILHPVDALRMRKVGFHACLVGQALVESPDTPRLLRGIRGRPLAFSVPNRRPFVKVCGVKTPEDVKTAADADVDAVGLVFAPGSPRLVSDLPGDVQLSLPAACKTLGVECWGVWKAASVEEIVATAAKFELNAAQVSPKAAVSAGLAPTQEEYLVSLRAALPPYVRVVVCQFGATQADEVAALTALCDSLVSQGTFTAGVDALLLDGAAPGSGEATSWVLPAESKLPIILAGGLTVDSVHEIMQANKVGSQGSLVVGVDVSSGVEASKGVKDPALVQAFLANARKSL